MMGNNHRTKFAHVERTSGGTKIKVSHPKVLQRVIEACRKDLGKNPDTKYMSIGPKEGHGFGFDQ